MQNKGFFIVVILLMLFSCETDNDDLVIQNLQDYVTANSNLTADEVIACAASKIDDTNTSFVFYYPIPSATEIQYFETSSTQGDKNDFSLYKPLELTKEPVFNGYLERFVRKNTIEVWCIVTFKTDGKLHKSNPIRLKHQTKPTEWTDATSIDFTESKMPKFSWEDGTVKENAIYFQVVTDANNNLLSGTYTYNKWFQYYKLDNVVLNITTETPPELKTGNSYNFTMMGVSEDNWVNLVIQKKFDTQ